MNPCGSSCPENTAVRKYLSTKACLSVAKDFYSSNLQINEVGN